MTSSPAQRADLRVLRLGNFASVFDRFAMPAMLLAIAEDFQIGLVQVGLAVAAYFFMYGAMQPVWGIAAGRFGAVRLLRVCTLAGAVATAAAVLAPSFPVLLVSRAIGGAVLGALIPTAIIHVGDIFTNEARHRGVTSLMSANALGTTLATVASGAIVVFFDWRWALAVSLVFIVAAAIGTLLMSSAEVDRAARSPSRVAITSIFTSRPAIVILAIACAEGAAVHGTLTYLPTVLAAEGLDAGIAGSAVSFFGLTVLAVAAIVGRISGRLRMYWLIPIGAGAGAWGALGLAAWPTYLGGVIAAVALGLAWAMGHSSMQTWATQVRPSARSMMIALFASALFLGNSLSAMIGGWMLSTGVEAWFFVGAACLLALVAAVGSLERSRWERLEASGNDHD